MQTAPRTPPRRPGALEEFVPLLHLGGQRAGPDCPRPAEHHPQGQPS